MAAQADWMEKDLYAVLGVTEDSDRKAISRAYRELARKLHPDTHPDDPDAAERFKEVTAAYDVIGDEAKRAEYDEFRRAVAGAGPGGATKAGGTPETGGRGPASTAGVRRRRRVGLDDFDGSTWSTIDPQDFDDLLGSVLGGTSRRATSARRGADLEAELDLEFETRSTA